MREVHIMIGVPGSGKSTFARRLGTGAWCISPDKIRKQLTGAKLDQSMNNVVFENMYHEIDHMMKRGDSFVIDATNANQFYRKELLNFLHEDTTGFIISPEDGQKIEYNTFERKRYQIIGWWMDVSFAQAILNNEERPENERVPASVIYNMTQALEKNPPSLDEGFDVLYRIKVDR